jgi:protein-disulfide isomerase
MVRGSEGLAAGFTEEGFPWIGAIVPTVTVTEFTDYQCPHCRRGHAELRRLVREHSGQLRLVHRHFPLDQACNDLVDYPVHLSACRYAALSYCAGRQGRFWEANDFLFENGRRKEPVKAGELASAVAVNVETLKRCAGGGAARAAVRADLRAGKALRIQGTPTYVIGGQTYPRMVPAEMIERSLGSGNARP